MRYWSRVFNFEGFGKNFNLQYFNLHTFKLLLTTPVLLFSQGPPKFKKAVLKKGDKTNFPKKGENVSCWYTGSLEDGTVFDTNLPTSMTNLYFKVILHP